jgi:hypothetical protein
MGRSREVWPVFRKPVFFTVAALLATANWQDARADNEPLLRPDGAVVFRDWGLYRPGVPTMVEGPYIYYGRRLGGNNYYYFPSNRHDPEAYRSPPPAGKPIPAEPYYRSWGTQSNVSTPATVPAATDIPAEGPSVIYAPDHNGHRRHEQNHRSHHQNHVRHTAGRTTRHDHKNK